MCEAGLVTNQTHPSTQHCVHAGHQAQAPGSHWEAVRATTGTPLGRLARFHQEGLQLARP
jgi:hypothetical protein